MTRSFLYSFLAGLIILPFFALSIAGILFHAFFFNPEIFILSANLLVFTSLIYLFLLIAVLLRFFVLTLFFPLPERYTKYDNLSNKRITVCLTAYNDEEIIGDAVKDFKSHKLVDEVIVVDNNCIDKTALEARKAGAIVVKEPTQGFGAASICALKTALDKARTKRNLVLFVEGDQTFISKDIDKFVAYIGNADMVIGTRTTKELSTKDSQVTRLIQYSNVFLAKLIQLKYWGAVRLTDVGCSMRLMRFEALEQSMPLFTVTGSAFSPHMIDMVLKKGFRVIEIPVYFKKRGGISKGIGSDFIKGVPTGFEMIWNIMTQ
ncbi:glycosyltransferase family 2 protein [Candidatus Micrarchaeota archaeon]|nr:glycosyltransferase family 2 protein [Candidatus Micrarchaeota archaeon]MBU2477145.1 glycosyltransferase family 2 protein [Candidatus Micrarchaeota archaeon]